MTNTDQCLIGSLVQYAQRTFGARIVAQLETVEELDAVHSHGVTRIIVLSSFLIQECYMPVDEARVLKISETEKEPYMEWLMKISNSGAKTILVDGNLEFIKFCGVVRHYFPEWCIH